MDEFWVGKPNDIYVKDEHYVSRFYLKYFTNLDGQLSQYNVDIKERFNKDNFEKKYPTQTGFIKNLYEIPVDEKAHKMVHDGFFCHNKLEDLFADIENQFAPYYKKLIDKISIARPNQEMICMSSEERNTIKSFIATTILRSPVTIGEFANGTICDESYNGPDFVKYWTYMIMWCLHMNNSQRAQAVFKPYDVLSFYRIDNDCHFWTTDFPVFIFNKNEGYFMPLTPKIAVSIGDKSLIPINMRNKVSIANSEFVSERNVCAAQQSYKYIYSDCFSDGEKEKIKDIFKGLKQG